MTAPRPGDRATKNGVTCYVQFVENGEVYGIRAAAGTMENYWSSTSADVPPELWEEPKPWWSAFRIALVDWELAVQDAVVRRAE